MSKKEELKAVIFKLVLDIAPEADLQSLDPSDNLREELDLDSMDFMNLVEAINKELSVNIPETDYAKVDSLACMLSYIEGRT